MSGRRWTLKLDGVDVRLPEADPAAALARLVRFEREAGLLEKDIIAVDLRMPDRLVVRLTEEAVASWRAAPEETRNAPEAEFLVADVLALAEDARRLWAWVWARGEALGVSLRRAAFALAVERIAETIEARGLFP